MSKKKNDEDLFGPTCSFCGRGLDEVIVIPGPGGAYKEQLAIEKALDFVLSVAK